MQFWALLAQKNTSLHHDASVFLSLPKLWSIKFAFEIQGKRPRLTVQPVAGVDHIHQPKWK